MKLKQENGMITFVMRAGKDFVRNTMSVDSAEKIISEGKSVTDTNERCGVCERCVDDTYYFPLEAESKKKGKPSPKVESDKVSNPV